MMRGGRIGGRRGDDDDVLLLLLLLLLLARKEKRKKEVAVLLEGVDGGGTGGIGRCYKEGESLPVAGGEKAGEVRAHGGKGTLCRLFRCREGRKEVDREEIFFVL